MPLYGTHYVARASDLTRMIAIRKVAETDKEDIWAISKEVIATGDTYVFAPDSSREKCFLGQTYLPT